jgi:hypothetical protein
MRNNFSQSLKAAKENSKAMKDDKSLAIGAETDVLVVMLKVSLPETATATRERACWRRGESRLGERNRVS